MSTLIKLRRDTAENWALIDPVLALGEPGYDTTNNELRIGDGVSAWSSLTPITNGGGAASLPLANGTSNFNIASINGNATITAGGSNTWTFDTTGNVTIPANSYIQTSPGSSGNICFHPDDGASVVIKDAGTSALIVTSDEANKLNTIQVNTYGNLGNIGGGFRGTFSRGTLESPSAVLSYDRLASFGGKGYDGSELSLLAGMITVDAGENWSPSTHATHISFYVTPLNSLNMTEVARIRSIGDYIQFVGNIIIGNGYVSTGNVTTSELPNPASVGAGARYFVTDADNRTWGNLAVGGAGNAVPVWSDGVSWYIG